MKTIFLSLFLALTTFCKAQSNTTIQKSISIEEIKAANNISDLITGFPADCSIKAFGLSLVTTSGLKTYLEKGNTIPAIIKNDIISNSKLKKIFVENIDSNCPAYSKRNYQFNITR